MSSDKDLLPGLSTVIKGKPANKPLKAPKTPTTNPGRPITHIGNPRRKDLGPIRFTNRNNVRFITQK